MPIHHILFQGGLPQDSSFQISISHSESSRCSVWHFLDESYFFFCNFHLFILKAKWQIGEDTEILPLLACSSNSLVYMAQTGPAETKSLELSLRLPCRWQVLKYLGHLPMLQNHVGWELGQRQNSQNLNWLWCTMPGSHWWVNLLCLTLAPGRTFLTLELSPRCPCIHVLTHSLTACIHLVFAERPQAGCHSYRHGWRLCCCYNSESILWPLMNK